MPKTCTTILLVGFAEIEKYRLRVAEVILNNTTYKKRMEDFINNQSQGMVVMDNFEQGIRAMIWGASILVSNKIPDNIVLLLSELKYSQVSILRIV